jgi:hypothetical protein
MKNAVKVTTTDSSANVNVDLGNGLVIYAGISIPPEVAQKLRDTSEQTVATLTAIKNALKDATDPAVIKAKIKEAVKDINDAAIASVYARTTKAVNSQITIADSLQVSANALQVQINRLQLCIKTSSTSPECNQLRTSESSADQGSSLSQKINEIRTNIDTIREFLGASVHLVSMLRNENYRGTVESLTTMTSMMDSISKLSKSLRNDLNNLSNAVNV